MNLITDPWIPVIRKNEESDAIAPWQIVGGEYPVVEINAPRRDFQGALYQFLIGLVQTCFAPEDEDEWKEYWENSPDPEKLKNAFIKVEKAFELYSLEGSAFLQDYSLPDGEYKKIASLLIEAPGEKTVKDNLDHFVKRNQINGLCSTCTATALFTLQTNAPSGGAGHRVGLRGGGPLTTLIIPETTGASLWKRLWPNVLNREELPTAESMTSSVMPWLGLTRLSDKDGVITTPEDVHPLQMYWGMPRRIRLEKDNESGKCDLCGEETEVLCRGYRTKKHGINYDGPWVHPLTPYRFDPEKKNLPLSLKGQKGGLGYRHWLSLALQGAEQDDKAAIVVRFFNNERGQSVFKSDLASLWCFGYDTDNMKARCWYEAHFPIFSLSKKQRINLVEWTRELILAAKEVVRILRNEVKSAWFNRPGDAKGDMGNIDQQFWEETEPDFYRLLEKLAKLPAETGMAPSHIYLAWFKTLEKHVFRVFEKSSLETTPEDLDLKRIISAQNRLRKNFYGNKFVKNLKAKAICEEAR